MRAVHTLCALHCTLCSTELLFLLAFAISLKVSTIGAIKRYESGNKSRSFPYNHELASFLRNTIILNWAVLKIRKFEGVTCQAI